MVSGVPRLMNSLNWCSACNALAVLFASVSLSCQSAAVGERSAHEGSSRSPQDEEFLARANAELTQDEFAYHPEREAGDGQVPKGQPNSTDAGVGPAERRGSHTSTAPAPRVSPDERVPPPASEPDARAKFYRFMPNGTCGTALPNPSGLLNSDDRDGSCRVCEHEPQRIPRCPAGKPAIALTHDKLQLNQGRTVSFRGQFGYLNVMCTARAGPCHCSNTCGARLMLFAPGTLRPPMSEEEAKRIRNLSYAEAEPIYEAERQRIAAAPSMHVGLASLSDDSVRERPPNTWPYVDPGGSLHCGGDEGSLCCPFRFERFEQWSDVIMTGVASLESEYPEEGWPDVYRFRMTSVCQESS